MGHLSFDCAKYQLTTFRVWSQVLSCLNGVRSIFSSNEQISSGLKKFIRQLVGLAVEAIGWDFKPGEDFLTGQLRALLITTAGSVEHLSTVAAATERLKKHRAGDADAIHPNLRLPVFRIGVQTGGRDVYEFVKKTYLESSSGETKELCLSAMGRVQDPVLVRDFLEFQFEGGAVALQDMHTGSMWLAQNVTARPVLWDWMRAHWVAVTRKLSGNAVAMDRYVRMTLKHFATKKALEELEAFFKDKDTTAFKRSLVQIVDTVRGSATYFERDEALLLEYLKAKGYA